MALGMIGTAWAQDRPGTMPQPRPLSLTATEASPPETAPDPATPVGATASPSADPAPPPEAAPQTGPQTGPVTGFPLPRFVSIKAAEANVRRGPSRSHRIDWVFQRRNMPVMVVAEHGHWRRIIDRDGAGGWVHHTLLSGSRTAIVDVDGLPILARPETGSTLRARAERDVIASLRQCRAGWCEIDVGGFRGWVEIGGLWGVDPDEDFD